MMRRATSHFKRNTQMDMERLDSQDGFKGRTVIVTGASNGIGRSVAMAFAAAGARAVIADTDEPAGEELARSLTGAGASATFIRTDVSDPDSIRRMIAETVSDNPRIDMLINNAGISVFKPFHELGVDEWDNVLNTNLRGAFLCSREASLHMSDGGAIVNIASTRALMSEAGSEAYAASKGGLLALTHAMAVSLSGKKITVNAISPGWIHTGDYERLRDIDHSQHPCGRVGKPDDIARACLFLCHPDNDFITGEQLVIDGGMTRRMIYGE